MDLDLRTVACNISVALLSSHMLHFNAGEYLMLHATLFLFKSTTFDVTNFVVSGNIHCLKAKHYNSQYAAHILPSVLDNITRLLKAGSEYRKYLSGKIQVERNLLHAWCKIKFIR